MRAKVSKHTVQSQETKRKILEAAFDVFVEKGFEGTTIKQITQRAGVAYSTAYVYFENKAVIFTHVVDETIKHLYAMARHPFFPTSAEEAFAVISKQCTMYLEIGQAHRRMMQVIQEGVHSSELIRAKWDQVRQYFIGTITQDITYAQNVGLVRAEVVPAIAAPAWQAGNEFFLWEIVRNPEAYDVEELGRRLTDGYVRSIYKVKSSLE